MLYPHGHSAFLVTWFVSSVSFIYDVKAPCVEAVSICVWPNISAWTSVHVLKIVVPASSLVKIRSKFVQNLLLKFGKEDWTLDVAGSSIFNRIDP
jgi:hypothetical protein